ncbi:MAG: hypothetical protein F6K40_33810 [Okeania sp. SIO3I5]|uniref:hypothetical protein n=1 Tax=Okeania sp. SIO3I5 TaxID=2607805 RepID=UPI0013BCB7E9|nr:hypothetical protein [Okeania sp. SIO3I5]NEQ40926.1 hypothetical protein [Okeania sp. SIO3I5]
MKISLLYIDSRKFLIDFLPIFVRDENFTSILLVENFSETFPEYLLNNRDK